MKTLELNHPYTPPPLKDINQALVSLIEQQEPDEAKFLLLVTERDDFIENYLLEVSDSEKQHFVKAEIEINGLLVACANELFKASLNQLSGLVRGRKAVEKYK